MTRPPLREAALAPAPAPPGTRTHALLRAVAALAPALLAAAHTTSVPDAAHDEATIRVVGLGYTGAWRALDALLASAAMLLPFGTRAFRAGLASAAIAGVVGALVYALARRLLAACADLPRLGAWVALLASMTATLGAPFQLEAATPGGSVLGALMAMAPLAAAIATGTRLDRLPIVTAILAAAFAYEPLVGATALFALGAYVGVSWWATRPWLTLAPAARVRIALMTAAAALVGAVPAIAVWSRAALVHATAVPTFTNAAGERGASAPVSPIAFVDAQIGLLVCAVAAGGAALSLFVPRARALSAALLAMALAGSASTLLGAAAGPTRFSGPVLSAIAAVLVLSAIAMQAVVRAVAASKLPLAKASAALVVLLELTLPANVLDASLARAFERMRESETEWEEIAWGALPAGAVVMLSDARVVRRVVAERATGSFRGDLLVVPTGDLSGPLARGALVREPKLAPFFRDMALYATPQELALSELATARPLAMLFDPRWDRALARHLVPVGLVARFEAEPRGASDRRRALDGFVPRRNQLIREIVEGDPIAHDPELVETTARMLRSRAIALTACGDKDDVVVRVIDDLHAFAPVDAVADTLARRAAKANGPVDVKDLGP